MQQFLQWLCKATHEDEGKIASHSTKKKETAKDKGTARSKEIVVSTHCGAESKRFEGTKFDVKKLKSFVLLCRRDIAKSCFYSTINIKRPRTQGFDSMQQYWIQRMKKEDITKGMKAIGQKADASAHAGPKILPITEATLLEQCSIKPDEKDKPGGDSKIVAKSRMKDLLRWAVAAKSEKGGKFISRKVFRTRDHGNSKAAPDDAQAVNDSPKISFSWEVDSCSTVSSAYSSISAASSLKNCSITLNSTSIQEIDRCRPRNGSWITTDSEFVVLEL